MTPRETLLLDEPQVRTAIETPLRAFDIVGLRRPLEEGAIEVPERRGRTSKVFRLPDGRMRLIAGQMPLHYVDGNNRWRDVDLTAYDDGDVLRFDTGFYRLVVRRLPARIEYRNPRNQVFILEPDGFGLVPGEHDPINSAVYWNSHGVGLSVRLRVWPGRVRVETVIERRDAPHAFRWRYTVPDDPRSAVDLEDGAIDAKGRRAEVRGHSLAHVRDGGFVETRRKVEVTGRTLRYDERRKKEWIDEIEYPVVVRD